MSNPGSAGAGRDGRLQELVERWRRRGNLPAAMLGAGYKAGRHAAYEMCADELAAILAVPDPLASDTGQGERPTLAQALERQVAMALRASEMAGMKPDEKAFYEGKAAGIRQALNSVRISASAPLASSSETQGELQRLKFEIAAWARYGLMRHSNDPYLCNGLADLAGRPDATKAPEATKSASPSDDGARQPVKPIRAHVLGCPKNFSVPVDLCSCGGRDVGPAAASDDGAAREPGLDLEPIKARVYRHYGGSELWAECSELLDIKAMLAEIERQRARIVVLETSVDSLRYLIDHPVWQSIESAPKDGTNVLLGWPKLVLCGYWADWHGRAAWVTSRGEYMGSCAPTHWMPLPSSPAGR